MKAMGKCRLFDLMSRQIIVSPEGRRPGTQCNVLGSSVDPSVENNGPGGFRDEVIARCSSLWS
jgi:hypothetical protein